MTLFRIIFSLKIMRNLNYWGQSESVFRLKHMKMSQNLSKNYAKIKLKLDFWLKLLET